LKTLVLGIGNPILSDDSAGLRVAQLLEERLDDPGITVVETSAAGWNLLDLIVGYDRVIIIDTIQTEGGRAGEIYRLGLEDFRAMPRVASPHTADLITCLELGKTWRLALPAEIIILAIEAADVTTFSESCTPEVEAAVPRAVEMVLSELAA